MIRLIAMDLDGTLLTSQGNITPETKSAIAGARAKGIRVVLATGRSGQEAADFVRQAGCDQLAVCLGGAVLLDAASQTHLRRWDMPQDSGQKALELCLGKQIELMIFAGEQILLDPFSKQSQLTTFPYEVFHQNALVTPDPLAYLRERQLPLTKLHGDGNPAAYPLEELAALPGVELTASNDHDFELVPAGVNKGRTLALLSTLYGVALEDCAALGDSENDLAMLQAVGWPMAMGNASRPVKEAAKFVTSSNDQEGAAKAIEFVLRQNER